MFWDLCNNERYSILTPKYKSQESYYCWFLRVKKYLEHCNLDNFLDGLLQMNYQNMLSRGMLDHFFKLCEKQCLTIFKIFVHRTKILCIFWKNIYYVLKTVELNDAFKSKFGYWTWLVDFESDRFVDDMGDLEDFEWVDSLDLHTIFGEIGSDDFVEKNVLIWQRKKKILIW